jgi:hypothetical protein
MFRISFWRLVSPVTGGTPGKKRLMVRRFQRAVNAADQPE